jgi:hypothetical protein
MITGCNHTTDKLCEKCKAENTANVSESELKDGLCENEFVKRYSAKFKEKLKCDDQLATQSAEAAFEYWDGVDTPEEMADEDLSYWAADA